MALELVGGAVLGVVFDQLRNEIWSVKDNVAMFKPQLEQLEEALNVLSPVIRQIDELNRLLNRPNHGSETNELWRLLEYGRELVSKCSKIPRWNFLKRSSYREKLKMLDDKIVRFHSLYMQAQMGRDQKLALLFLKEIQMLMMSLNQQGFSNLTMGVTASPTNSSYLTVDLTASSNDSSKQIKIVFKVKMHSDKLGAKAPKLVSRVHGVSKFCAADICSVGGPSKISGDENKGGAKLENNNVNGAKKGNPLAGGVQAMNPMGGGHHLGMGGGGNMNMNLLMGPMGNKNVLMGPMGSIPAVQGLPSGGINGRGGAGGDGGNGGPGGYLQWAGPESMPGNLFHQQQYMA